MLSCWTAWAAALLLTSSVSTCGSIAAPPVRSLAESCCERAGLAVLTTWPFLVWHNSRTT